MNECFFIGKVESEVDFKFILNGKNASIAKFKMQLSNNSKINVKAYNILADYVYRKVKTGDLIFIYGKLQQTMDIVAGQIEGL